MDIGAQSGANPGTISLVVIAGLLFGTIYAIIIHQLKQAGRLDGYTALAVVVGVLISVALSAFLIGIINALLVILIFITTGTPMIIGDIYNYTEQRKRKDNEIRQVIGGQQDGN